MTEGLSAEPTTEQDSDERSDGGSAALGQLPLCSFFSFCRIRSSSGGSGSFLPLDQRKRVEPALLVPVRNPQDPKGGLEPVAHFFVGKTGFDWYQPGGCRGPLVPVIERSEARGDGACGTTPFSSPSRPRARGRPRSRAAQVGALCGDLFARRPEPLRRTRQRRVRQIPPQPRSGSQKLFLCPIRRGRAAGGTPRDKSNGLDRRSSRDVVAVCVPACEARRARQRPGIRGPYAVTSGTLVTVPRTRVSQR